MAILDGLCESMWIIKRQGYITQVIKIRVGFCPMTPIFKHRILWDNSGVIATWQPYLMNAQKFSKTK